MYGCANGTCLFKQEDREVAIRRQVAAGDVEAVEAALIGRERHPAARRDPPKVASCGDDGVRSSRTSSAPLWWVPGGLAGSRRARPRRSPPSRGQRLYLLLAWMVSYSSRRDAGTQLFPGSGPSLRLRSAEYSRRGPVGVIRCVRRSGSFRALLSRAARAAPACAQRRASRVSTAPVAMPMRRRQPDDAVEAARELAALADGSLAPERRAELEAGSQRARGLSCSPSDASGRLRATLQARSRRPRSAARIEQGRLVAGGARRFAPLVGLGKCRCRRSIALAVRWLGDRRLAIPRGLTPTELVPNAGGKATMARHAGWRIELEARAAPARGTVVLSRRGCATGPASWFRSGPSTRARRSRCGRAYHQRVVTRPDRHAEQRTATRHGRGESARRNSPPG